MKRTYSYKRADGELMRATVEISYSELADLVLPHIAPDGYLVDFIDKGHESLSIGFRHADFDEWDASHHSAEPEKQK